MSTTSTPFDLDALTGALEHDDPDAIAQLYAEHAVVEVHNRDHGPGNPLVIRGRDGVRDQAKDVAARHLTHRVHRAVTDGHTGAVQLGCTYPDGAKVLCLSTFEVADGQIVRETRTDVWDG